MKRFIHTGALVVAIAFPAIPQTLPVTPRDPHQALVATYCVTCHNTRLKTGGLALEGLDLQNPADDAQIWEKALRKLRGHQMPPPGSPQPMKKDVDSFVGWMESTLDSHATNGPKAGYVPIQRLNRTEYTASVKTLVGVDVNAKDVLPQDIQVEGFDNVAAALSVSPAFLDQYVTAARQVARLAVGNPDPRVSSVRYNLAGNEDPDNPTPPGTRGGIRFKHNFPADGEYRITINDLSVGPYTAALERASTMVILIDDKIVFRRTHRRRGGSGSRRSQSRRRARSGHGALCEDSRDRPSRRARCRGGIHRSFPCGDR